MVQCCDAQAQASNVTTASVKLIQARTSRLRSLADSLQGLVLKLAEDVSRKLKRVMDDTLFQENQLKIVGAKHAKQTAAAIKASEYLTWLRDLILTLHPAGARMSMTRKELESVGKKPLTNDQLVSQLHHLRDALVYKHYMAKKQKEFDSLHEPEDLFSREHPTLANPLTRGRIEFSHAIKRPPIDADLQPPRVNPIPLVLDTNSTHRG